MPQSLYEWIWIFLGYGFIGWCAEVIYVGTNKGSFVNRGFLNGPSCPIYGFGMVLVVAFLYPLRENKLLLFFGSMVFASALEFLTGWILERFFHSRWWDYSDRPFQVRGYICLQFSLLWGLGGVLVLDVFHVFVYGFVGFLPYYIGYVLLVVFVVVFVLDCYVTVRTILHFTKKLRALEEFQRGLHHISDGIGENIFENSQAAREHALDRQLRFLETVMETKSELSWRLEARLLKAFPRLEMTNRLEALERYKRLLRHRLKK